MKKKYSGNYNKAAYHANIKNEQSRAVNMTEELLDRHDALRHDALRHR